MVVVMVVFLIILIHVFICVTIAQKKNIKNGQMKEGNGMIKIDYYGRVIMSVKKGLGKGLDSLISEKFDTEKVNNETTDVSRETRRGRARTGAATRW